MLSYFSRQKTAANKWEHSSAGRASALQAEGHRFESYCSHQRVKVLYLCPFYYADVAHLVERHLAKVEVAGSSPVIRSIKSVQLMY